MIHGGEVNGVDEDLREASVAHGVEQNAACKREKQTWRFDQKK